MKNFHIISLSVIALLFILIGVWKYIPGSGDGMPAYNNTSENDRASVRAFWDHFNQASAFMNAGVYDSAAVYYEHALDFNDEHEGTLYNLGNARLILKDFDEAEFHWQKLIALNPNSARSRLQLGTLYFCLDDQNKQYNPKLAKTQFIEAHKLNREETGPPLHLSKIAILNQNYNDAGEYLEVVLASNFMSYQAMFLKGYIEWKQSKEKAGFEKLSEAFKLYETLTQVTMAGEGATSAGFRPMLSEDMYCDFIGSKIETILHKQPERNPDLIFNQFDRNLKKWRLK